MTTVALFPVLVYFLTQSIPSWTSVRGHIEPSVFWSRTIVTSATRTDLLKWLAGISETHLIVNNWVILEGALEHWDVWHRYICQSWSQVDLLFIFLAFFWSLQLVIMLKLYIFAIIYFLSNLSLALNELSAQLIAAYFNQILSSGSEVWLPNETNYTSSITQRWTVYPPAEPTYIVALKPALPSDIQKIVSFIRCASTINIVSSLLFILSFCRRISSRCHSHRLSQSNLLNTDFQYFWFLLIRFPRSSLLLTITSLSWPREEAMDIHQHYTAVKME